MAIKGNPNHPKPGSTIKVEPIKDRRAINSIKKMLYSNPRDYCMFVLGINTAMRANELLSIKVHQVRNIKPGDDFEIKQSKTGKYRRITINKAVYKAIKRLLDSCDFDDDDYLFKSQLTGSKLTVPYFSCLVKSWCKSVGLKGNYGSHTLRKTWGYFQRVERNTSIALLMEAFGHARQRQTLEYLCIQPSEIKSIYLMEL